MREQQPITAESDIRSTIERHPAFGTAVVTRGAGTPQPLFQSDVQHSHTITLSIHRAQRRRDLNSDWVHPTEQIVEIEMSPAQWGALVSSVGVGSGVPVTIRATETDRMVADLPYQPRIAENLNEVSGTVEKLLSTIRDRYDALAEAIDQKKGAAAIREARRGLDSAINNGPANAEYAVSTLQKAAEKVVAEARADVEAHILATAQATGIAAPIQVPTFELTGGEE